MRGRDLWDGEGYVVDNRGRNIKVKRVNGGELFINSAGNSRLIYVAGKYL
jgi:hypothetical protein